MLAYTMLTLLHSTKVGNGDFDITFRGLIDQANAIGSVRAAVEQTDLDEQFFTTLKSRHEAAPTDAAIRAIINAYGEICGVPELVVPHPLDVLIQRHWSSVDIDSDDEDEMALIDNQLGSLAAGGSQASGYGEVTRDGTRALFFAMGLTEARRAGPAVFYDLGSGYGRVVAQAWLELAPKAIISRAVGIELASSRHEGAVRAWGSLSRSEHMPRQSGDGGPEFILGSMLDIDLSQATHVFMSNYLFDDLLLNAAWQTLEAAPRLEVVASLRKFPNAWPPDAIVKASMNWNDACPVYLYRFARHAGTQPTQGPECTPVRST